MATIDVEVIVTVTLPDILGEIKLTREQAMELRDSLNAAFPTMGMNVHRPGVRTFGAVAVHGLKEVPLHISHGQRDIAGIEGIR